MQLPPASIFLSESFVLQTFTKLDLLHPRLYFKFGLEVLVFFPMKRTLFKTLCNGELGGSSDVLRDINCGV